MVALCYLFAVSGGDEKPDDHAAEAAGVLGIYDLRMTASSCVIPSVALMRRWIASGISTGFRLRLIIRQDGFLQCSGFPSLSGPHVI